MVSKEGFGGNNVFVDASASIARSAIPESCLDCTTCITPKHPIYSTFLERYVQPKEMLGLQAMWQVDSSNPAAFKAMSESSLAQDLCGNGMTGTVAQAVVLAALASSDAFLCIQRDRPAVAPSPSASAAVTDASPVLSAGSGQHGGEHQVVVSTEDDVQDAGASVAEPSSSARGRKRKQADPNKEKKSAVVAVPKKRIRGKQSLLVIPPPKKKHGTGPGNKNATGKCPMVSIFQREAICKAYDAIVEKGAKCPDKELKKLKMVGYYRGCALPSKWGKSRQEQKWGLLCTTAPNLCKAKKELPNSLRLVINFPTLKHGANHEVSESRTMLPVILKRLVEETVMERVDLGEEVGMAFVKNTILFLVGIWNDCVGSIRALIGERNLEVLRQDDEKLAKMSNKELDELFVSLTQRADEILVPIQLAKSDDALKKQAERICNTFGLRPKSLEKPGAHLAYDAPALEAVRSHIRSLMDSKTVHPQLVMNFDQVWSLRFRPRKTSLQKDSKMAGLTKDPLGKSWYMRKVRHSLQLSLDLPLSEPNPNEPSRVLAPKPPRVLGGKAACGMIDEWRVPRTVTTLSFADGYCGRLHVTLREGTMPEEKRNALNEELKRWLVIDQPQSRSHMWNEETFVRNLSHLSQELRHRRRQLGLSIRDRALCFYDQAAAHMSKCYMKIQERWSQENNCELMSGHSEIAIPGGFGASGAPNDSWHQVLHCLTKSYTRLAVGWGEFPHLRRKMEELEFSVQGQPCTKCPIEISVRADAFAMQQLSLDSPHNKLIWIGWISRGYTGHCKVAVRR
eukprot:s954_g5.t1